MVVNIHNTTYVVSIYDVNARKPRIFASKIHIIRKSDSIVLVDGIWKK